jgi:hypothetical protein
MGGGGMRRNGIAHQAATMAVAAGIVVLAAAGVTYALTYGPQQVPGAADLPVVITARGAETTPGTSVGGTDTTPSARASETPVGTSDLTAATARASDAPPRVTSPTSNGSNTGKHEDAPHGDSDEH